MTFEEWTLNTPDGKTIYGEVDFAEKGQRSDKVLVMVHGLTGHMAEYHIKGAANYFSKHGYDVIRFNLYGDHENARWLKDCTLQTHAADLNLVLDKKALGYDKIFIAGHSYGGPTIMIAQPEQATALSLWDPTFDVPKRIESGDFKVSGNQEGYIWNKAVEVVLGEAFIEERRSNYRRDDCLSLSENLSQVPIQVVAADGENGQDVISWHSAGHPDNHRHIIKGADHCFWRGNVFEEVLMLTHRWFDRF